jgi:hypothetical protein
MRLILGSLVAVAACGGDSGGPDVPPSDAASSVDGFGANDAAAQGGLTVTWDAQPMLPGPLGNGVAISSVKFKLARLEVIGDTGSTVETTQSNFDVVWSAAFTPFPITFSFAQPGLYSKVSLQIDGNVVAPSYEILGSVLIGGTTEPFKITDTAVLQADIDGYDVALMAGGSMSVPIRVDLQDAIDAVDFAMLPAPGGVRTMDQNTTGIAAVRSQLEDQTFKRNN